MRWVSCSMHEKDENAYKIFIGRPKGKRPHRISRYRWEDNIRIYFRVNTVMNLEVP